MSNALARLRRDPGGVFVVLAILLAAALYAPTLGRGLINYDDPWLVHDNWIVQHHAVRAILLDLSTSTRAVLGAEYLPVRDLSIALDFAIWGQAFWGFHLTSLLVYLTAIVLWFFALDRFGVDRRIAGLTCLIWAVHPAHAESVAWLSERKGLLAVMFTAVAMLGYAQFRRGRSTRWLVLAMIAAAAAVWSKAPALFALPALAVFELALPEHRVAVRRSVAGLAAIAASAAAAFVPVLVVAIRMSVVAQSAKAPAGWLSMVIGLFGTYLRLGAMLVPNAVSYPIATDGPTAVDLVLGAVGLLAALAVVFVPRRRAWRPSPIMRAAVALWLLGWFPVSRIVLPVKSVLVADRYLLFPSLGLALALAVGVFAVTKPRIRFALGAMILLAASLRTLDAQSTWSDARMLWARAVESNPHDSDAWSLYVEALTSADEPERAADVLARGEQLAPSPRLTMHEALMVVRTDRARGVALMQAAAEGGEPRAMTNLALLLSEDGQLDAAVVWARRAVALMPGYANGYRILGKVLLAKRDSADALDAFQHAFALEPGNISNRFNLALALVQLGRASEARAHLEACLTDPQLGPRARQLLSTLPR